jgi:hypothetical protein
MKHKQTIHGAAFESVAAFCWTVLLLAIIAMVGSMMIGCEMTGDPATDFTAAGETAKNVGKAVPPPAGSWIELVGVVLAGIGGVLAQEKRVRNEKKKVKDLENKGE